MSAPAWLRPAFVGTALEQVHAGDAYWWKFSFAGGGSIATSTLWRAVSGGAIAVTSEDHGQQFGLPEPVDAARQVAAVLRGPVTDVRISPATGDLLVEFGPQTRLEFLNTSRGYESWEVWSGANDGAPRLIGLGGGGIRDTQGAGEAQASR